MRVLSISHKRFPFDGKSAVGNRRLNRPLGVKANGEKHQIQTPSIRESGNQVQAWQSASMAIWAIGQSVRLSAQPTEIRGAFLFRPHRAGSARRGGSPVVGMWAGARTVGGSGPPTAARAANATNQIDS